MSQRTETKQCNRCGVTKSVDEFYKASGRSGHRSRCKKCYSTENTDRYLRLNYVARVDPEYCRAYYQANSGEIKTRVAEYRIRKPEMKRKHNRTRRARRSGARLIKYTPAQLTQRLSMFGGKCYLCAAQADAVDHVKPLARGGWECLANLRPICTPCNSRKGAKWPYPAN